MRGIHRLGLLLLAASAGCGGADRPSAACGIAALTGPLVVLEGFARDDGLAAAPPVLPPSLLARYVAGPVGKALVSRDDSMRVIAAVQVAPPERAAPGYGVLLVDREAAPLGILIYDGMAVRGAVQIGTVAVGDSTLPLFGLAVTPAKVEDARCPLFPSR